MSLPKCDPKYSTVQQLQATADQLQIELDALQAAIDALEAAEHDHDADYSPLGHDHAGVYSPTAHNHAGVYSPNSHNHAGVYSPNAHNHAGVYSPLAHAHTNWQTLNNTYFTKLTGGLSGTQTIAHATVTEVTLDTVIEGYTPYKNGSFPNSIVASASIVYLWVGMITLTQSDQDKVQVWIYGPENQLYGQAAPQLDNRAINTTIQVVGVGPGGTGSQGGVRLMTRHESGANRTIAKDGRSWLMCMPIGATGIYSS